MHGNKKENVIGRAHCLQSATELWTRFKHCHLCTDGSENVLVNIAWWRVRCCCSWYVSPSSFAVQDLE